MTILYAVFYFVVALSILVFVHELGHFLAAKAFKVRVEKFYIGFDFWNAKVFSFKRGETEYGIGAIPLGGYVKMSGMIDESMDTSMKGTEPQPYEFRSKPAWQKLIILSGGVLMNFLLAALIFATITIANGETRVINTPLEVDNTSAFASIGFQTGDKVLEVNGQPIKYYDEIIDIEALYREDLSFKVQKEQGDIVTIVAPKDFLSKFSGGKKEFPTPLYIPKIGNVLPNTPAEAKGVLAGDVIVSISGVAIHTWMDAVSQIEANQGKPFDLRVLRGTDTVAISIQGGENGKIGVAPDPNVLKTETASVGFFAGIAIGFEKMVSMSKLTVVSIAKIFTGAVDASKSLGGPVKIAKMAGENASAGMDVFMSFVAMLSISLGVLNLAPVPALDGGHIVVTIIEMILRKELSINTKIRIQQTGTILLLMLILFILYNDIVNL